MAVRRAKHNWELSFETAQQYSWTNTNTVWVRFESDLSPRRGHIKIQTDGIATHALDSEAVLTIFEAILAHSLTG